MANYLVLIILTLFFSCGKKVDDNLDDERVEELSPDGIYSAVLVPVNSKLSTNISGDVTLQKFSDDFRVSVRLKNAPPGRYRQQLHTGSACPKSGHDIDGDGYIDGYESRVRTGPIILPFDGDLSSQSAGATYVLQGSYSYTRSTSYYLMLSDLHLPDDIVNDAVVKLTLKDLFFERRAVTVYAVSTGRELPVACGLLTRISNRQEPDNDNRWEDPERPRRTPRSPGRRRPVPEPRPEPQPEIDVEEPRNGSWWDRVRQRWRRWRDRWRNDDQSHDDQYGN